MEQIEVDNEAFYSDHIIRDEDCQFLTKKEKELALDCKRLEAIDLETGKTNLRDVYRRRSYSFGIIENIYAKTNQRNFIGDLNK